MIWVGPYTQCVTQLVPASNTVTGCTNKSCSYFKKQQVTPYCGYCGLTTGGFTETSKVVQPKVDPMAVIERIQEAFFLIGKFALDDSKQYHVYGPNKDRNAPRTFSIDADGLWPIRQEQICTEIGWLAKEFVSEITVLRRYYEIVEVDWGIVVA